MVLLMEHSFMSAEVALRKVAEERASSTSPDGRYVHFFCRSVLQGIDGDEEGQGRSVAAARALRPARIVTRLLPL